jgi:quinol monooxygenase YgiN
VSEVVVLATIQAKPGKERETEALLQGLLQPTHAEPGCVFYALHRKENRKDTFVFIEKWRNAANLPAHLTSSHIKTVLAHQAELLLRLDIEKLVPILGGEPAKNHL